MRYGAKWPEYAQQWDAMVIRPNRLDEFKRYARRLLAHKEQYVEVERATGVPWYLVALLHLRESDADFSTYLGNGDPLSHKTTHVPRGRGPFPNFLAGAIDALKLDGLTSIRDWRLEKVLYCAEIYNGVGYDIRHLPSPYLWGGTNIQKPGKFVSDGHFDASKWDSQPGIAPILRVMMGFDTSIDPERET